MNIVSDCQNVGRQSFNWYFVEFSKPRNKVLCYKFWNSNVSLNRRTHSQSLSWRSRSYSQSRRMHSHLLSWRSHSHSQSRRSHSHSQSWRTQFYSLSWRTHSCLLNKWVTNKQNQAKIIEVIIIDRIWRVKTSAHKTKASLYANST